MAFWGTLEGVQDFGHDVYPVEVVARGCAGGCAQQWKQSGSKISVARRSGLSKVRHITTTKEARCSTFSQAAGIVNALAMSFYLPVLGPDILIQKFAWVMCSPFSLSARGQCSMTHPVFCWGRPTCLHRQSQVTESITRMLDPVHTSIR